MAVTASDYIDNKVIDIDYYSQNYLDLNNGYIIASDRMGNTYSRIYVNTNAAILESYDIDTGGVDISLYNQDQTINDGSSNNRLLVTDKVYNKGLVYPEDYTANFTTYSLVSKGYVDSQIGNSPGNGLEFISPGVIGLGGTLSNSTTIIDANDNSLAIDGLSRLRFTASTYMDFTTTNNNGDKNKIFTTGQLYYNKIIYGNNPLYSTGFYIDNPLYASITNAYVGGTYSTLSVSDEGAFIEIGNVGTYSGISTYTQKELSNDGSNDNTFIVRDDFSSKGLVYLDDYTPNFTTHSLVSKGYADSVISRVENGLTYSSGNIEIGGSLNKNTVINGEGFNFSIENTAIMVFTSSMSINKYVDNSSGYTAQSYLDSSTYYTTLNHGNTYSQIFIDVSSAELSSINEVGDISKIVIYNEGQSILDGSTDNKLIVVDTEYQKGIVYDGDYTGQFTTHSLVTKGYVDSIAPAGPPAYKVYTALLSQSGTASPTSLELENTFGVTATFSYSSTGYYELYMTSQFTSGKTFIINGCPDQNPIGGNFGIFLTEYSDINKIRLSTLDDSGTFYDGMLNNTSIEIRVYP
jgi:hypothetical protein